MQPVASKAPPSGAERRAHIEALRARKQAEAEAIGVDGEYIAEARAECALSMVDVRMHVLSAGDRFDLGRRRPERG